jgi:CubicO group peptidase (beta-lactamase class C family)
LFLYWSALTLSIPLIGTFGWIDRKKDLVGVFLVQRPGADTERNAFMAMAASAIVD